MPDRPGLLVTGATGVLGSALLPLLGEHDVVALTHHTDAGGVRTVRGDLTRPRLGLDDAAYGELVARTTTVVHSAAVTSRPGRSGTAELLGGRAAAPAG